MTLSPSFTRATALCCLLTVITTLAIHLGFPEPPRDFEKRVLLFQDSQYLLNRWVIIAHCLLVIISMWGFTLIQLEKNPGSSGLGFLFIVIFGVAEIARQFFVFYYLNDLREQYVQATDPAIKALLKEELTYSGLLTAPLFGLFIFCFGLGNFFLGLSLRHETGFGKILCLLLILWSFLSFATLGNHFWKSSFIDRIINLLHFTYQPFVRLLLGLWLWGKSIRHIQTAKHSDSYLNPHPMTDHRLS